MAVTDLHAVADYIISVAREAGDPITNLKLQKLVYYAQAWHLALFDEQLIDEEFQAWVHGPVCPRLYQRLKGNTWRPIEGEIEPPELDAHVTEHLDEVMEVYGGYSAWDLERLTHAEAPWRAARGDLAPDELSTAVISEEDMRSYYRARADTSSEAVG